jgi:membrane protein required for colicin V production
MSWIDIIVIVLLAVPTFIGLKIGLIKAVLSIVGVIVGVVLAGQFYEPLADAMGFISNPSLAKFVAFAIILIGVMVIAGVAAWLIKWAVSLVMLGWVNRIGGAVIGFLVGAIFCGALLTIWINVASTPPQVIEDSLLAGVLVDAFPLVLALLPSEFDSVRSFFQH